MHCSYFLGISQKRVCDERNKGEEDALSKARESSVVIGADSNSNIYSSIHPTSSKPIYDIIRHASLPAYHQSILFVVGLYRSHICREKQR